MGFPLFLLTLFQKPALKCHYRVKNYRTQVKVRDVFFWGVFFQGGFGYAQGSRSFTRAKGQNGQGDFDRASKAGRFKFLFLSAAHQFSHGIRFSFLFCRLEAL